MKSKKNFHFYNLSPTRYGHISLKIDLLLEQLIPDRIKFEQLLLSVAQGRFQLLGMWKTPHFRA